MIVLTSNGRLYAFDLLIDVDLNTYLKMNLENCGASRLLSMYTGKRLAQMQLANFWGIHSG